MALATTSEAYSVNVTGGLPIMGISLLMPKAKPILKYCTLIMLRYLEHIHCKRKLHSRITYFNLHALGGSYHVENQHKTFMPVPLNIYH